MDREISADIKKSRRRRVALRIAAGIVAAGVIVGLIAAFSTPTVKFSEIQTGTVSRGALETTVRASGTVAPAFEMIINSPVESRIDEVYCHAGDTLAEGTPLLRLDLTAAETELKTLDDERRRLHLENEQTRLTNRTYIADLEMQMRVKEMELNRLRQEMCSERRLDSIGSGTGDRVRQAEFAYETARLQLDQLRRQLANERGVRANSEKMKHLEIDIFNKNYAEKERTLDDAKLRSPRAATLTFINDRVGARVGQGERVATIADLSHFKISSEISDALATRVVPGGGVTVKIGSTAIEGHITAVEPTSKGGVITFDVALDDDTNPRLRSGLRVDVHVKCDIRDDAVRIPAGSYYRGPGDYTIFTVDGNALRAHKVKLGESNYEYVEVISGLNPGETVVTSDMTPYANKSKLNLK